MCLTTITSRPKPSTVTKTAYKVCVLTSRGQIAPAARSLNGLSTETPFAETKRKPYQLRKWFGAKVTMVMCGTSPFETYESGFHVVKTEKDGIKYGKFLKRYFGHRYADIELIVVPVLVRNVHTVGKQGGCTILVGQHMKFEHGCIKRGTIVE